jgi:predicted XRE-type DNA-binding protein
MKERLKMIRGSDNIFLDLGFDKAEAENLKLRSQLMMRIDDFYRHSGMTQGAAAKALGITQPRLNALLKGRIGQFSLDALVNIASRAGLNVRLVIRKAA